MSAGIWAIGSIFRIEDRDNPGAYLVFPEVINITFNRGTRENIDLTNHQSTPPFEEFIKGIATGAQLDITFNFLPANAVQAALEDEWLEDTPLSYQIELNDGGSTTYTFEGFLSSFSSNHDTRNAHRGSASIACTGAWSRA